MDNGKWQESNIFEGLEAGSTHKFYCRVAETDVSFASSRSAALTVTLEATPAE